MANSEQFEKARQEVMRFRELLDIMRGNLEYGERAYAALFANIPADELAGLKEKERQGKAGERLLADKTPISQAALDMRFYARELERAFEEFYNIIATEYEPDDE
jgi:hypothetical protein